jgi:hypothetical protein
MNKQKSSPSGKVCLTLFYFPSGICFYDLKMCVWHSICSVVTAVTFVKQEMKYWTVYVNTVCQLTYCLSIKHILCKYGVYCVMKVRARSNILFLSWMFPIPLCTLSALQMEMRWQSKWQVSWRHESNDKWSIYSELSNCFGSPGGPWWWWWWWWWWYRLEKQAVKEWNEFN